MRFWWVVLGIVLGVAATTATWVWLDKITYELKVEIQQER